MWVAVGVALVMSVVLHLLGLAALCACNSHLPGPAMMNGESIQRVTKQYIYIATENMFMK